MPTHRKSCLDNPHKPPKALRAIIAKRRRKQTDAIKERLTPTLKKAFNDYRLSGQPMSMPTIDARLGELAHALESALDGEYDGDMDITCEYCNFEKDEKERERLAQEMDKVRQPPLARLRTHAVAPLLHSAPQLLLPACARALLGGITCTIASLTIVVLGSVLTIVVLAGVQTPDTELRTQFTVLEHSTATRWAARRARRYAVRACAGEQVCHRVARAAAAARGGAWSRGSRRGGRATVREGVVRRARACHCPAHLVVGQAFLPLHRRQQLKFDGANRCVMMMMIMCMVVLMAMMMMMDDG